MTEPERATIRIPVIEEIEVYVRPGVRYPEHADFEIVNAENGAIVDTWCDLDCEPTLTEVQLEFIHQLEAGDYQFTG